MVPVAGAGTIGEGFDRQGLVVPRVEGELPGSLVGWSQCVGAQRDATDPGALEPEGVVHRVRRAGQEDRVLRGFGQGPAAACGTRIGVADRAGHARGDLAGGTEAGTEVIGEGEQGAPMGGRVEFVMGEAMLGADACRCRRGVDELGVVALGALMEGTAGAGPKQALQRELGDGGDVADSMEAVLGERRGRFRAHAGQVPDRAAAQEVGDGLGGVGDDGAPIERGEGAGHGGEHHVVRDSRTTAKSGMGKHA